MSTLNDARKTVNKLEGKRDTLQGRLATAQAEQQLLDGQWPDLERRVFGCDEVGAEVELQRVATALVRNAAQQRGVAAELVKVVEDLNAAREVLRSVQLEADAVALRKLDKEIGPKEAELNALFKRRAALVSGRSDIGTVEDRARHMEAVELETAREVYAGCTITRRITSEEVHNAPR